LVASTRGTLQTDKTETNNKKNIAPLAETVDPSLLGERVERALTEERAPSPPTPEPPSSIGSEETED